MCPPTRHFYGALDLSWLTPSEVLPNIGMHCPPLPHPSRAHGGCHCSPAGKMPCWEGAGKTEGKHPLDTAHSSVASSEMPFWRVIYLKGVTDTWISALPVYVRGFPEEKTHTVYTNWIKFLILGVLANIDCCNAFSFPRDNTEETDCQMLKRSTEGEKKTNKESIRVFSSVWFLSTNLQEGLG